MNSYERVMARLKGEPVDRVPNLCIMMNLAAKHAGICYRDFCLCPEKMVEANLKYYRDYDIDIVTVMSDPFTEAMDYGMDIGFPENDNPKVNRYLWYGTPNPDDLIIRNVEDTVRMRKRVKTIQLFAEQLKGECPITGWIEGALAEYCDLKDISSAMMDFAEEEPFLDEILEKITQQAKIYIKAQVEAGADIIGLGDAACSLLSANMYDQYGFPYEKELIDYIHQCGALVKLHICGNIRHLLPRIAQLGADIVDVDWMVDFGYAAQVLDGISSISGNFDPSAVMLSGTPETIRSAVLHCLDVGGKYSMISAGCEVPRDTPHENLRAVADTLREVGPA